MLIGLGLIIFSAFVFFTKEKVVSIEDVEIIRNEPHHFNWSPLIRIAIMDIGGVVLWQSYKNSNYLKKKLRSLQVNKNIWMNYKN